MEQKNKKTTMTTNKLTIKSISSLRDKTTIIVETNRQKVFIRIMNDSCKFEDVNGTPINFIPELAVALKEYQTDLVWELEPYQKLLTILNPYIVDSQDKSTEILCWIFVSFTFFFFLIRFIFNI